jgi:hypothetical protein
LLSQRLFWERRLCGAKSKELGPTALKQLLIFIRLWRILRATSAGVYFPNFRSQKTFNPSHLSFYSYFWDTTLEPISKIVDRGSGQGAGWRKSGAYTAVCEHFEPARNTALDP